MRHLLRKVILLAIFVHYATVTVCQGTAAATSTLPDLPVSLFDKVSKKMQGLEEKMLEATAKTLNRLAKQEQKIRKKLYKKDSSLAKQLFF